MQILAISTGSMQPDNWVKTALQIHEKLDYLHIREPYWSTGDLQYAAAMFLKGGGDGEKMIVNAKTPGVKGWQGKIHYPERDMARLAVTGGGVSVHDAEKARKAELAGAAYVIFGPVFAPLSKQGVAGKGISAVKEIVDAVSIPVIAVGGITPGNISDLKETGIQGIAVISSVFYQEHPVHELEKLRKRRDAHV